MQFRTFGRPLIVVGINRRHAKSALTARIRESLPFGQAIVTESVAQESRREVERFLDERSKGRDIVYGRSIPR